MSSFPIFGNQLCLRGCAILNHTYTIKSLGQIKTSNFKLAAVLIFYHLLEVRRLESIFGFLFYFDTYLNCTRYMYKCIYTNVNTISRFSSGMLRILGIRVRLNSHLYGASTIHMCKEQTNTLSSLDRYLNVRCCSSFCKNHHLHLICSKDV